MIDMIPTSWISIPLYLVSLTSVLGSDCEKDQDDDGTPLLHCTFDGAKGEFGFTLDNATDSLRMDTVRFVKKDGQAFDKAGDGVLPGMKITKVNGKPVMELKGLVTMPNGKAEEKHGYKALHQTIKNALIAEEKIKLTFDTKSALTSLQSPISQNRYMNCITAMEKLEAGVTCGQFDKIRKAPEEHQGCKESIISVVKDKEANIFKIQAKKWEKFETEVFKDMKGLENIIDKVMTATPYTEDFFFGVQDLCNAIYGCFLGKCPPDPLAETYAIGDKVVILDNDYTTKNMKAHIGKVVAIAREDESDPDRPYDMNPDVGSRLGPSDFVHYQDQAEKKREVPVKELKEEL